MDAQEFEVIEQMSEKGGSFAQALAQCFRRADPINFMKLKMTFHEEWTHYENFAKQK